jgi:hypothetical protein
MKPDPKVLLGLRILLAFENAAIKQGRGPADADHCALLASFLPPSVSVFCLIHFEDLLSPELLAAIVNHGQIRWRHELGSLGNSMFNGRQATCQEVPTRKECDHADLVRLFARRRSFCQPRQPVR